MPNIFVSELATLYAQPTLVFRFEAVPYHVEQGFSAGRWGNHVISEHRVQQMFADLVEHPVNGG